MVIKNQTFISHQKNPFDRFLAMKGIDNWSSSMVLGFDDA
jgi:hypothetical protein